MMSKGSRGKLPREMRRAWNFGHKMFNDGIEGIASH